MDNPNVAVRLRGFAAALRCISGWVGQLPSMQQAGGERGSTWLAGRMRGSDWSSGEGPPPLSWEVPHSCRRAACAARGFLLLSHTGVSGLTSINASCEHALLGVSSCGGVLRVRLYAACLASCLRLIHVRNAQDTGL